MPQDPHLRVGVIVQARMGSTRLPQKILKKVLDKPLLAYQIERLRRVKNASQLLIATTTDARDQVVEDLCRESQVAFYRGSQEDVLDRYYQAAKAMNIDVVVRICSDCPLEDPVVVDLVIDFYCRNYPAYDYVSNTLERTYPRGLDVEVFSFKALERAAKEALLPHEREHVTPYFYEHSDLFTLGSVVHEPNTAHLRWTVDTEKDFELISLILQALYPKKPQFTTQDVLDLLEKHPDWIKINADVQQKPIRL